jgi:hypothetical protein
MKILKKVKSIEVKRAFAISDHLTQRKTKGNNRKFLKSLSETQFRKKLSNAKKTILKLKVKDLDKRVSPKWPKRIEAYNACQWFLAEVGLKEAGVWKRAGNLPLAWTNGSLYQTARHVKIALSKNSKLLKQRPRHAIPNILTIKTHLEQKEKYLYPIAFKSDTGTRGRKGLKHKVKADIDDGNMRSIALAISGKKSIRVYFGVPH